MVRFTSGMRGPFPTLWGRCPGPRSGPGRMRADIAFMPQRVVLVLAAEVAERGIDDPARGVAETAEAASVLERVGNLAQVGELDLGALVREDALVHAHRPVAADATWRALAARLVCVELQEPVGRLDDAVAVVHHDHAARSAHGLGGSQRL